MFTFTCLREAESGEGRVYHAGLPVLQHPRLGHELVSALPQQRLRSQHQRMGRWRYARLLYVALPPPRARVCVCAAHLVCRKKANVFLSRVRAPASLALILCVAAIIVCKLPLCRRYLSFSLSSSVIVLNLCRAACVFDLCLNPTTQKTCFKACVLLHVPQNQCAFHVLINVSPVLRNHVFNVEQL